KIKTIGSTVMAASGLNLEVGSPFCCDHGCCYSLIPFSTCRSTATWRRSRPSAAPSWPHRGSTWRSVHLFVVIMVVVILLFLSRPAAAPQRGEDQDHRQHRHGRLGAQPGGR